MEDLKRYILNSGLINQAEADTMIAVKPQKICDHCKKMMASPSALTECKNKSKICFECLEDYFDNSTTNAGLFICPCCNQLITEYILD